MRRFQAEADYGDSIFRSAIGDNEGSLAAVKRALEWDPNYAPAILTLASFKYQRRRRAEGRKLLRSLLSLPEATPDLPEIIDQAGDFLIDIGAYEEGLALFQAAAARFPSVAAFHQGVSCCASHQGLHEEAVAAAERALRLEPDNQKSVNDLGWSLLQAGRHEQARAVLERAVSMDPTDELASENLRRCEAGMPGRQGDSSPARKRPTARQRRRPKAEQ